MRIFWVVLALFGIGTAWIFVSKRTSGHPTPVTQPIAFDHKVHMKEDVSCVDCHKHVETGSLATIVPLEECMSCHDEPQGKNPEEHKVRQYSDEGREIAWIIVNRLPGHVYYSHRAHVKIAKMECKTCHGDMKQVSAPITSPNMHLKMSDCIECHQKKGARIDCTICHK